MNKIFNIFFIIILCSGCSFNKNSKFWTSEKIKEIEEKKFEEIYSNKETLSKELNTKINLNLTLDIKKNKL